MDDKQKALCKYRLEQAEESLDAAKSNKYLKA